MSVNKMSTMKQRQSTKAEIRYSLGHGKGNRRVRISHDSRVSFYGSTDPLDRSQDYWHCARWTREYVTRKGFAYLT